MPKKEKNIKSKLTISLIHEAAEKAFKSHQRDPDVIEFKKNLDYNLYALYIDLHTGEVDRYIHYTEMQITSNNGKMRNIDAPCLPLRILQHTIMLLLSDVYKRKDNGAGKNCKEGYGINSKKKNQSVIYPMKQVFYDRLDLNYWLLMDQRKCYEHVRPAVLRKAVKRLTTDKWLIRVLIKLAFTPDGRFPIGTPSSPFAHHLIMLDFDLWMRDVAPFHIRYADDNLSAYHTREEMNAAKWRIANYWWYNYGIRVKRSLKAAPFTVECDFCGYRFFRNNKGKTEHNKGHMKIRGALVRRIYNKSHNQLVKGWPSYFGLLKWADTYNLIKKITEKMNLRDLTAKLKINREMDAKSIDMRDLVGEHIAVYDYDIRQSSTKEDNWIKLLIGIPEHIEGELTGRMLAREVHGNYQYIMQFLRECEKEYGKKNLLPLEGVEIINQCGYIFKDSTNQMKYIEV